MTPPMAVRNAAAPDARYPVEGGKVVPYLLLSEEFIVDGVPYYQTFDAGAAVSATLGIEGYVWPYVRVGQRLDEPPSLWMMVLDFAAPPRWVAMFQELQGRYLAGIWRRHEERWEMRERALCDGLSVLVPRHPDPGRDAELSSWRMRHARRFLMIAGIDPDDPEIIMSDLPYPLPLPAATIH